MSELTKHSWEALASVTWGTLIKLTIKIEGDESLYHLVQQWLS